MNYPFWDVPFIGSTWVIGAIAIFHVMVSHFAVGGGLYLAMAEYKARKEGRTDWLKHLKKHSYFFLVLTGVYGAVTGVAIWFAIGLAQPEGTSTLIHNFVFGWAIEWVFFIVELTAAAVYYYTWNRIPDRTHQNVGWLYAITSLLTLVIINGILTFMLTPGESWMEVNGTGKEASRFWQAFFNPTYFPSLFMRIAVCCSMAGIFGMLTASRIDSDEKPELKTSLVRWSAGWLFPSFLLMPIFFLWYLSSVPADSKGLLELGITTIGQGTFTQVTRSALVSVMTSATVLAFVYFIAYHRPTDLSFGHAMAIMFIAAAATGSTEYAREMLRKPYVISGHMYSNGVRKSDVEKFNAEGFLKNSPWLKPEERADWQNGTATGERQKDIGHLMFLGQCSSCHTVNGYRPMASLIAGRDATAIQALLETLHKNAAESTYRKYMPPLVGTATERKALAQYLASIGNPSPTH